MKSHTSFIAALSAIVLTLFPLSALAGDQVVGVIGTAEHINVYAKPYDTKAQTTLVVKNIAFPLSIVGTDGDFLQVRISAKAVWLDGKDVEVGKPVQYGCVKAERQPKPIASIQGASAGCK